MRPAEQGTGASAGDLAVEAAGLELREATAADIPAIRRIYAYHVEHGTGTFEETAPNLDDMTQRWQGIVAVGLPYLVCAFDGRVSGFAYASRFRPRSAYRFTVEDSIYVDPEAVGGGIGRLLLGDLIERCTALGHRQMVAVIGDSRNSRSIQVHARHGFQRTGLMPSAGFKFGRWLDVVFMQRALGAGDRTLPGT
jgi:phosphinothricin acetyltransferase